MKKRICFAGFATDEVACLEPDLAKNSEAWDFVFSPDAAAASNALSSQPFDAIVANLHDTGLNGLELTDLASSRPARTLLFVLGDMADREQTNNCIGNAHQFISRPWKPHELLAIIGRSLALDGWLCTEQLRAFLPRLGQLPGLSSTYFEVVKKTESSYASVENVAEIIARDPALTARLLQVANSPACGLSERVTQPAEAVAALGLHAVRSIVLCLQLNARPGGAAPGGLPLDQIWRQSFQVARLAHKIVSHSTGGDKMAGDAYTAGLLHRVGQIVLADSLSDEYSTVLAVARKRKCPLRTVELEKWGVTQNQVGAYLLGVWGLPLALVEAVAFFPNPRASTSAEFSILTAVHVAEVLVSEEIGRKEKLPVSEFDEDYLKKLDLPLKTSLWRKALETGPGASQPTEQTTRQSAPKKSRAPAQPSERRPFPIGLAFAALGLGALGYAGFYFYHHPREAPTVLASVTDASPPAADSSGSPTPDAPTPSQAPASPLDSIRLQGIFYQTHHSTALINGEMIEPGGQINGAQVINIQPTEVVLAYMGEQRIFKLK